MKRYYLVGLFLFTFIAVMLGALPGALIGHAVFNIKPTLLNLWLVFAACGLSIIAGASSAIAAILCVEKWLDAYHEAQRS